MAHSARHALAIVAALAAATITPPAFGQEAPEDDPRFSDFRLRTQGESDVRPSDAGLAAPLDPAGALQRLDDALEPAESEDEPAPPALQPFDLFEGPESTRATRQNLPGAVRAGPLAGPAAAGDLAGGRAAEPAAPPPARLDVIGPVRQPTQGRVTSAERLNRAGGGLRPAFPALPETDPYAPDGIRVGRFRLFPVLEQEIGVSDNLGSDSREVSGAFTESRLSARLLSDWSRHELEVEGTAGYRHNGAGSVEDEPRLGLDTRLRLDISRDLTGTLRGSVSYAREDPILADPLLPPSERPDVLAYSAAAEIRREVGRLDLTAVGEVVREERRIGGDLSDLSGADDFTTTSLGLRAGYEVSPAFQPFLSASVGRRMFDERAALTGADRDSTIASLRLGVGFDFGEKLSGEAAVGYAVNDPIDDSLPRKGAATFDAAINWSPRRGTDVLLSAATFFDPDASNLSTSTVYEAALAVRHRATARLDVTGRLSAAIRDRDGPGAIDDTTYAGEIGLTYWLNRGLALTARARHERLDSDVADVEYSANSVLVGVRLQR